MKTFLFQGDSITDADRRREDINNFGYGYPNIVASKYMSANAANMTASGSSVAKGETLIDTVETINAMATDILVMRHNMSGAPHLIAPMINASVVNAGDGMNEHPTQGLLDMLTIREKKGGFKGLKVAIIGDVYHSRVVRSNIYGLTKLGAEVTIGGPATLIPYGMEQMGVKVMLAGSMGEGAKNKLESHNIRVIRGCAGDVESVVKGYLTGFVFDSGVGCVAHNCHEH